MIIYEIGAKNLKFLKNLSFLSASAIILVTVFLVVATYLKWIKMNFMMGPYYFGHWLGWIGTFFFVFATPTFYILKRRYPKRLNSMVGVHIFGNLFAFMFVSLHFAQQISRPPEFFPELGTGIIQYVAVLLLVSTGFIHKFHTLETRNVPASSKQLHKYHQKVYPPHRNRFVHISITLTFYLVIIFHVVDHIGLV
jgi:hypothetical protein